MATFDLVNVILTGYIADVSTAGQIYIPVPSEAAGEIIEINSVIDGTIATGDTDLTAKIGGTAVTNGVITITESGSAAGDVDTVYPTAARTVSAGDSIEIETDGVSTNTVQATITITIRR